MNSFDSIRAHEGVQESWFGSRVTIGFVEMWKVDGSALRLVASR